MIKKPYSLLLSGVCLALLPLVALGPGYAETEEDDELELERTIDLQAKLVGVETVPRSGRAIARFRIFEGEYSGALFSLGQAPRQRRRRVKIFGT